MKEIKINYDKGSNGVVPIARNKRQVMPVR